MKLTMVALFFTLAACAGPSKNRIANETARFNEHVDQEFERVLAESPQGLTNFGRKERYHELNDLTEAFRLKMLETRKSQLAGLKSFDRASLDAQARLTYELFEKSLIEDIEDFQWRNYRYPVTQHGGVHTELPTFMINKHKVLNEKDLRDYVARLGEFKRVFVETVEQIRRSESEGIVPPKFVFAPVIDAAGKVIQGRPFDKSAKDSPLLADFKSKLAKLNLLGPEAKELSNQAERALLESVQSGYQTLIAALKDQETRATNDAGAWKFPRGQEFYAVRLNRFTTTTLSADQIHELGLKNVERLRGEMLKVKERLGIKGDLKDLFKASRTDKNQYFPNTEAGRQAYLKLANSFLTSMNAKVPEYFHAIPKTPMEIRAVEKFRENSSGKAFYDRPSDDGSRPGVYYVNLKEMKDVPKFEAEALLYHEGTPGHHFQIAGAIEMKGLPKLRRYGRFTAYSEGWGLYTELLGKEMGGYKDPYSELGRLSMEMLRAGRLVVDTGIHHKKWTREQALKYFSENLPVSEGSQREQIERYIVMPGQATAYMVGMLKILELRERARQRLGEKFDIRDFHAVILSSGAVPLDTLEKLVSDYAEARAPARN